MGYGQVNVGGNVSKTNIVTLFNNDSPQKHQSTASSIALQTTATTTVYYALFGYTFGAGFQYNVTLQGSNDNVTWTDIYKLSATSTKECRSHQGSTSGYTYYRLTSSCSGDEYGPRTNVSGVVSTSELNLIKGNN